VTKSGSTPLFWTVHKIPIEKILKTEYGRLEVDGLQYHSQENIATGPLRNPNKEHAYLVLCWLLGSCYSHLVYMTRSGVYELGWCHVSSLGYNVITMEPSTTGLPSYKTSVPVHQCPRRHIP
jgi:hypothetical protein